MLPSPPPSYNNYLLPTLSPQNASHFHQPTTTHKKCKNNNNNNNNSPQASFDPLQQLGSDIFQCLILPRLDSRSLARSTSVTRQWLALAVSDSLWAPLCRDLWATRAHLPFQILRSPAPASPYRDFCITMEDARKVELTPEEMCGRIWEMRVKPTCGSYWLSLDPTSRGATPLLRRFHCDHSITAVRPNDPIWGGNESLWEFAYIKSPNEEIWSQHVQINRWPHHRVAHLSDGRWCLDNAYATYTTCPDQKSNMSSFLKGLTVDFCPNSCHHGSDMNVHSGEKPS